MPNQATVEATLKRLGFTLEAQETGRENHYVSAGSNVSQRLDLPNRYEHPHLKAKGQGSVYIAGDNDAVLIATGPCEKTDRQCRAGDGDVH